MVVFPPTLALAIFSGATALKTGPLKLAPGQVGDGRGLSNVAKGASAKESRSGVVAPCTSITACEPTRSRNAPVLS